MAKKRRRRRRGTSGKRVLVCALVEILVLAALGVVLCWDKGIGARIANFTGIFDRAVVKDADLSGIHSANALLMDGKSGEVISETGGEERIYPASMTKIMTAIVAIEELSDTSKEITLSEEMFDRLYAQDATQAGFLPGETVRAIDLLYGVMLPSGAECCIGLAEEIAGTEEAFVELMNKKADSLGMDDTHFKDSTGLHDPEHYSTCRDMAVLLRYALHNDTFREIIESSYHSTPGTNIHPDGITYWSTLFRNLPDPTVTGGEILGGKTGYTDEAGHCLASFAEIDGREYILVTAGAPEDSSGIPHIEDARTVYNRLGAAILENGGTIR